MSIQDDIVTLTAAIGVVERRIKEGDREVQNHSFDELMKRLSWLQQQEERAAGKARSNVILSSFSSGRCG